MKVTRWRGTRLGLVICSSLTLCGLLTVYGCGGSNDNSSSSNGLPGSRTTTAQVTRGRYLVTGTGCTDCHAQGLVDPSDPQWFAGYQTGQAGQPFQIGPFKTYAANITPDTTTGIGNFTDRQIYNALKFGLDPSTTPDVVITSTTPGSGNYPATPHYLAPPMPWPAIRHLSDDDIWAIVAYLKHGITPIANTVPASQGPPDFWASSYAPGQVGPIDLPNYPSGKEQFNP